MTTFLGLFLPRNLEIVYILHSYLHFLCICFLRGVFAHGLIKSEQFFNQFYLPIDGTLTSFTTPNQSGHGSSSNKEELHISQKSKTEASPCSLVSYQEHLFGGRGVLLLCLGYSRHFLSLTDRVRYLLRVAYLQHTARSRDHPVVIKIIIDSLPA